MQRLLVEILDDDVAEYTAGELALTVSDAYVAGGAHVKVTALNFGESYEYNPHATIGPTESECVSAELQDSKLAIKRLDEIMGILNNCANTGHMLQDCDYESIALRVDAVKNHIRTGMLEKNMENNENIERG